MTDLANVTGGPTGGDGPEGPAPTVNEAVRRAAERMRATPPPAIGQPAGSPPAAPSPEEPPRSDTPAEPDRGASQRPRLVSVLDSPEKPADTAQPAPATPTDSTVTIEEQQKAERYVEMFGGEKVSNLAPAAVKALAKALDDNNRLAQLAKQQRTGGDEADTGKAQPEPAESSEGSQPPGEEAGQPAPSSTEPPDFRSLAIQDIQADPEAESLRSQYVPLLQERDLVLRMNPQPGAPGHDPLQPIGAVLGGELVELDGQIRYVQSRLDAEKFGDDAPSDIERDDLSDRLDRLQAKRETALLRYERLNNNLNKLADAYDARIDAAESRHRESWNERTQVEEARRAQAEAGEAFLTTFDLAVAELAKQHGLSEGDAKELALELERDALLELDDTAGRPKPIDPVAFVKKQGERHIKRLGFAETRELQGVGRELAQINAQNAPRGQAAIAELPTNAPDGSPLSARDKRRAAERRVDQGSRRVVWQR